MKKKLKNFQNQEKMMTITLKQNAKSVLSRSNISTVPVDVNAIAENLGLKIYATELEGNVSGKIVKKNSDYVIYVDRNEPVVRQRFTAAHEIGHFILHRDSIGDGVEDNHLYRAEGMSNQQEVEANKFAADLLMPYSLIKKSMDEAEGRLTANELAKTFNVSVTAMSIRLGLPT